MNQRNATATTSTRSRQLLLALLTAGFVSVAVVVLGEFVVRVFAPQQASWLDIYRYDPELPVYTALPNIERSIDTGETRWSIVTDDRGFRGASQPTAADLSPGAPVRGTVLALGDSFTFGHGVNYEDSFIGQLARSERSLHYVNTALPGYGPLQYRQVLERELSRDASEIRLLLVGTFLGNDFSDCIRSQSVSIHDGVLGDPGGLKSTIKRSSHLYRLIAKAYHRIVPRLDEDPEARRQVFAKGAWAPGGYLEQAAMIYEREFAQIAELAKVQNVPMLVIVVPARETLQARRDQSEDAGFDYDLPVKFATEHFKALEIPFVDMTPVFVEHPTENLYLAYDGHLTQFGNELVSQAVSKRISALLATAGAR